MALGVLLRIFAAVLAVAMLFGGSRLIPPKVNIIVVENVYDGEPFFMEATDEDVHVIMEPETILGDFTGTPEGLELYARAYGMSMPGEVHDSTQNYTAEEYLAKLANNAEPYVAEKEIQVYTGGKPAGADQKKRIAIVLEGLNKYENLSKIITVAEGNGAKLTLLATGSVVDKDSELQAVLRQAYDKQFEIENHTYDEDKKLYSLPDEEMAYQIYMTQIAVNNALHVDYKMHFLYLPFDASHTHDQGQNDPRTHQYLDQLGSYVGVVGYTYKAIDAKKLDNIKNNAKDGSIMLFKCSNNDYNKLKEFIPWAVSQNFELVTLNELFGYDANEITNLSSSVDDSQVPAPKPYLYRPSITLGSKDYKQLYAVQLLQNRLKELGYLSDDYKADGYYGDQTTIAVKLFQLYNDLTVDGYAGKDTQLLLFSSEAKSNPSTYIADKPETYPPEEERAVFN